MRLTAILFAAATLLAAPVNAQTMSPAQCNEVMMVGPQNFSAAVLAACQPYFTSLADNAVATGTFQTRRPGPVAVTVGTSGSGG